MQQQQGNERPMTIAEASEFLSLAKETIYGLTHRREIPHLKVNGKGLRFWPSELRAWLEEGRVRTRAEIAEDARERVRGVQQ